MQSCLKVIWPSRVVAVSVLVLVVEIVKAQTLFPSVAGSIQMKGALLYDPTSIAVSGNYAYVASSGSNAMEVINISNPSQPVHVASLANLARASAIVLSGNFAFVSDNAYLNIVDISDPTAPKLFSRAKKGFAYSGGGSSMFLSDHYVYVAAINALEIFDISDLSKPTRTGYIKHGDGGAIISSVLSVFVSNGYAYLVSAAASNALQIVDISNPASPIAKGNIVDGQGGAKLNYPASVIVSNHHAYIASSNSNALEVIDISNPNAPTHAAELSDGIGGASLSGPSAITIKGNYAYLTTGFSNGLEIVDISDPINPKHASTLTSGTGGATFGSLSFVSVIGNYAYLLDGGLSKVTIVDISSTNNPTFVGEIQDGAGGDGTKLSAPNSVAVSGSYAYVASLGSKALEIINISDSNHPTHVASVAFDFYAINIFLKGNYAYVAGPNNLKIVDVTNPNVPVKKGSVVGTGFTGNLVSSVFASGNYAYMVNSNTHQLEVIDISDPNNPNIIATVKDQDGGATLSYPGSIYVSGNYAYVTGWGSSIGYVEILDVTNPSMPFHKATIFDGDGGAQLSGSWSIKVVGNYAYVASAFSEALEIINVSDPAKPTHAGSISHYDHDETALGFPTSVFISGNYAYVSSVWESGVEIIDITNPASPVHAGKIVDRVDGVLQNDIPLEAANSVVVSGNYAYVASPGSNSLTVLAILAPAPPSANDATITVTNSTFTASWSAVSGATSYQLDVSSDNFETYLSGYNSVSVSGTSKVVDGISTNKNYQYRVRSVSPQGVSINSEVVNVSAVITGDIKGNSDFSLYPNPADNYIFISGIGTESREGFIFDSIGKSNKVELLRDGEECSVNVQQLLTGLYYLQVRDNNGIHIQKFIKR